MTLSRTKLIIIASIFLTLFYNYTFFLNVFKAYPLELKNIGFLFSLVLVLVFLNVLIFTLISSRYTVKFILIFTFLVASLSNYFMNTYNVIIDDNMIRNILQTNINESLDLLNIKQVFYFLVFGILPSLFIWKLKIKYKSMRKKFISKAKIAFLSLTIISICMFSFTKHYSSFLREHKPLRFSINPTYWMYSIGKYVHLSVNKQTMILRRIGEDAKINKVDIARDEKEQPKLIILVVGEASRADHFSLNGYDKVTNPLLAQENLVSFSNMYSCGTSTAESLPCMFSMYDREDYSYEKGVSTENILDVLSYTNQVNLLWRDNNSDSKGVALRIPYENYRSVSNNTLCIEGECRDEGMLIGLDEHIKANNTKDTFIVLHQMGNHGPSYYKRYPKSFEKFTPVCKTNQLEECTQEEISNGYDNALLYTDDFLSKTINFLKKYNKSHKVAMLYMSDHGESLGENGVYLHGLPYFMAPDAQIHIGAFMWLGTEFTQELNTTKLDVIAESELSHDNLFHTLLGIFEVDSKLYNKEQDILYGVK